MNNKILTITAALAVMIALTGVASALSIDINKASPYNTTPAPTVFTIAKGETKTFSMNILQIPGGTTDVDFTSSITCVVPGTCSTVPGEELQITYLVDPWPVSPACAGPVTNNCNRLLPDSLFVTLPSSNPDAEGTQYDVDIQGHMLPLTFTAHGSLGPQAGIPEFPTVALPVAAVIGLVFLFNSKNRKEE